MANINRKRPEGCISLSFVFNAPELSLVEEMVSDVKKTYPKAYVKRTIFEDGNYRVTVFLFDAFKQKNGAAESAEPVKSEA